MIAIPQHYEAATRRGFILRGDLPPGWRIHKHMASQHFIELIAPNGEIVRFKSQDLVKGECNKCKQVIYVESRIGGMVCPHCRGGVNWTWGTAKLSFVADSEARFSTVPPPPILNEDDETLSSSPPFRDDEDEV